jgi:hypothetical protein
MPETPYKNDNVLPKGTGWIKSVSYLLDEQFRFPGTKFRFGLDPIMNIIPGIGDFTGFVISSGLLFGLARKGASNKLVVLMCLNILIDSTIGAIPIIGQIFDFFFKSNTRNLKLMREHYIEGKHQGSGKNVIIIAVIFLIIMLVILVFTLIKLSEWVIGWF